MQSQRGQNSSPGGLKPNIPLSLDEFDNSADVNDLRRVLDILDAIHDNTKDIIREASVRCIYTHINMCETYIYSF